MAQLTEAQVAMQNVIKELQGQEAANKFAPKHLTLLIKAGYIGKRDIEIASRENLILIKLPPALVDWLKKDAIAPVMDLLNVLKERNKMLERIDKQTRDTTSIVGKLVMHTLIPPVSVSSGTCRADALDEYKCGDTRGVARCMFTNRWYPEQLVRAAHITAASWHAFWPEELGSLVDRNSAKNIIMILIPIKKALDRGQLMLFPLPGEEFQIVVLDPNLLNDLTQQYIQGHPGHKTADEAAAALSADAAALSADAAALSADAAEALSACHVPASHATTKGSHLPFSNASSCRSASSAASAAGQLSLPANRPSGSVGQPCRSARQRTTPSTKWSDIHLKSVIFIGDYRPQQEACLFHARQARKVARNNKWIKEGDYVVPDITWPATIPPQLAQFLWDSTHVSPTATARPTMDAEEHAQPIQSQALYDAFAEADEALTHSESSAHPSLDGSVGED